LSYDFAIMEAMRQSWSDDRLDDLNKRVDDGFARVDAQFARVDAQFARVDRRFETLQDRLETRIDASATELREEMRLGFHEVNSRFDRMQQTMIRVGGGLIGVLFASGAGLIATQL
jgi:chromosome segregation ATPase